MHKRLQERFNLSKKLQVLDEVNKKIDAVADFGSNYIVIDNIDNLTSAWNEVVKICKKYDVEATIKNRKIYIADDVGDGGDDFATDDDPIWFDENYSRKQSGSLHEGGKRKLQINPTMFGCRRSEKDDRSGYDGHVNVYYYDPEGTGDTKIKVSDLINGYRQRHQLYSMWAESTVPGEHWRYSLWWVTYDQLIQSLPKFEDELEKEYNKLKAKTESYYREDNRAMGTKLDRDADISSFIAGTVVYIKGKRTVLMATDIEDKEDGEYLIFVIYDRNTDKMSAPIRRKISPNKDGDDRISYGGWDVYIHDFEEVSDTGALEGGYGVLDSKPVGNLDPPRRI